MRIGPFSVWRSGRRLLALPANVVCADLVGSEEPQKGSAGGGSFDGRTAVGIFALNDANDCGHPHAGLLRSFNGVDGGTAGRADVIDNNHAGAFAAESFDAAASAVSLLCLADEESVKQRRAGAGERTPGAGSGYIGNDGVGAHRQSSDRFSLNAVLFEQFKNCVASETAALCVERSGAAVDVVVAGGSRSELERAKLEAGTGEKGEQLLCVCRAGHLI